MTKRNYAVTALLLPVLASGLLWGCSGKPTEPPANPGTPEERKSKDAEAQGKESGGGAAPSKPGDHGNTANETGGASAPR